MAVAGIPVDQELKKAFQDLQSKMIATRQQLKMSDAQIETLKRQKTHAKVLDQEISTLPSDTRTYEGVGRMFILQEIPQVRENLMKKIETSEEKIKTLTNKQVILEKSLKDSEDNLREMIMSKQSTK
ncbi:prefoldin subunit 1 isoform X2 [Octopus bimaculoides]|uniref:Prefoldin subunit 1 n=1 Tax=Octopus bimaculoides TaxID=37653 RepID=A0A0L8FVP1_OCTBM|nr:prefoldin subunit 1 isoform X2 [Octopus bimaculoides]XP_052829264.1 prefoldin subunit 1 isoform X2 [Octopus bimaculoides]|eukprot:XP_014786477.1 PREDICTED: prefoldin subunit 1-like [Octopus bimaculoides]